MSGPALLLGEPRRSPKSVMKGALRKDVYSLSLLLLSLLQVGKIQVKNYIGIVKLYAFVCINSNFMP